MKKGFTVIELLAFILMSSFFVTAVFNFQKYTNMVYFKELDASIHEAKRNNFKKAMTDMLDNITHLKVVNMNYQVELIGDEYDMMFSIFDKEVNYMDIEIYLREYYVKNDLAVFTFCDKYGPFEINYIGAVDEVYFNKSLWNR